MAWNRSIMEICINLTQVYTVHKYVESQNTLLTSSLMMMKCLKDGSFHVTTTHTVYFVF